MFVANTPIEPAVGATASSAAAAAAAAVAKSYSDRPAVKNKDRNKNAKSQLHIHEHLTAKTSGMELKPFESSDQKAPTIIGLYGLPGCGKTFLLNQLKQDLALEDNQVQRFSFYDGSAVLDQLVSGGLAAFKALRKEDESARVRWRERAITWIADECVRDGKTGVVTGHLLLWDQDDERLDGEDDSRLVSVHTQKDLQVYTHMIYLDVDSEIVSMRRLGDEKRKRPPVSLERLRRWRLKEREMLRELCFENGIFFVAARVPFYVDGRVGSCQDAVLGLVKDFRVRDERYNLAVARRKLDDGLLAFSGEEGKEKGVIETFLVFDADRTLSAKDATAAFWTTVRRRDHDEASSNTATMCPLKHLFSSEWGYSFEAFYQAALLYEGAVSDDGQFDTVCQQVADAVTIHPEFMTLLQRAAEQKHVQTVVITCGLHRIWEMILARHELANSVVLIGSGRIAHGYVVDPHVKAALVTHLKQEHKGYVWAFGDSPLDLEMMKKADRAIVVVGEAHSRSKSMDAALQHAITNDENSKFRPQQVLLPQNPLPRLNSSLLPVVDSLLAPQFINSILERPRMRMSHATEMNASKLLATAMRDACIQGPQLRDAHRRAGSFLALYFVADLVGMESYEMAHTQGSITNGYRLLHEKKTLIVPLMCGGEPMAFGVSDVFPLACFLHAKTPEDVTQKHLAGMKTIILVDSVVNSGKTIVEFVTHIRKQLDSDIRIVVVAGVGPKEAVSPGRSLEMKLPRRADVELVFLRLSENRYTGKGGTDTGNRLFNTTHLD